MCKAWRGGEGGGGCRGSEGVGMDLYASPERRMSFIFLLLSWLSVNITIKVIFLWCLLINIQALHLFQYPFTKGRAYEKTVGTFHFCEKIKISSWKIKWFVPFNLGSLRKYRLWFEAMKNFYSFKPVDFVVGCSPTESKFVVLCLWTRFPPGWFVYM